MPSASYVIYKVIRKYSQIDAHKSKEFVDILNDMLDEDPVSSKAHS